MIVGIDTNSYGFHAVASVPFDNTSTLAGLDGHRRCRFFQSRHGDAQVRRLETFHAATELFGTLEPRSIVCVEEPIILRTNIKTTLTLTMMAGCIEAAFYNACPDAALYWVNISTWRRHVLNPAKGQAPRKGEGWKELARTYVLDRADSLWPYSAEELEQMFNQPDFFDAACISAYGRTQI